MFTIKYSNTNSRPRRFITENHQATTNHRHTAYPRSNRNINRSRRLVRIIASRRGKSPTITGIISRLLRLNHLLSPRNNDQLIRSSSQQSPTNHTHSNRNLPLSTKRSARPQLSTQSISHRDQSRFNYPLNRNPPIRSSG